MREPEPTRQVAVKVFTTNNMVTGFLHIPTTGYRTRVSDFLNQDGTVFVPITNARLYGLDGVTELGAEECVILNKQIIQAVIPIGEDSD
jgi:hypothetical protein